MPECIVCKGYYDSSLDTVCRRCGSDNAEWLKWRASEPVEKEGLVGLLRFTHPHGHIPLLVILTSLGLGLLGIGGLWEGIAPAVRLLATVGTVAGCLLAIQSVYERRYKLREAELLARLRTAKRKTKPKIQLSAQLKTILMPAIAVGFILLLTYALVKSDDLWKLANWLLLEPKEKEEEKAPEPKPESEPSPPPSPDIRDRIVRALPLTLMTGYMGLSLSLTYSSSMMLARQYTKRMNQAIALPIFLQDEKLARVVRKEAEVELGRIDPKSPNVLDLMGYVEFEEETDPRILRLAPGVDVLAAAAGGGSSSPRVKMWGQAGTWIWDELERTQDGGIKMKVARQEMYQLLKKTDGSAPTPNPRVSYVVHADKWGRITKIERGTK